MSRPQSPPSPVHPAPNEEIKPESLPTTQLQNDDLDLNPDLYDDNEEGDSSSLGQTKETNMGDAPNVNNEAPSATGGLLLQQQQEEEKQEQANSNSLMTNLSHSNEFDNIDLSNIRQVTLPFEEEYQLFRKTIINSRTVECKNSNESTTTNDRTKLTSRQQSKFINYIDEQLLQVQRKFIKQQSTDSVIYPFISLIKDLDPILDVIWVSITGNNNTYSNGNVNGVYNGGNTISSTSNTNSSGGGSTMSSVLFGQEEYYIKILGDLEDFITHYTTIFDEQWTINSENKRVVIVDFNKVVVPIVKYFNKLDLQLSFIKDEGWFSQTQCIRLKMIVERLRIQMLNKFEHLIEQLLQQQQQLLKDVLEVEASKIFEGTMERLNG
ncbi:hypothetical protein I9W82_001186 [Candida metapsilosis]|uniref:Uncharacterized protein n=1 Tax=Candida metapsilosis TaxID=273372 RepID=A0A8H8DD08_9ASCO|nr:hypothetical protein I9W82_001186 [Candida metapsilosis]